MTWPLCQDVIGLEWISCTLIWTTASDSPQKTLRKQNEGFYSIWIPWESSNDNESVIDVFARENAYPIKSARDSLDPSSSPLRIRRWYLGSTYTPSVRTAIGRCWVGDKYIDKKEIVSCAVTVPPHKSFPHSSSSPPARNHTRYCDFVSITNRRCVERLWGLVLWSFSVGIKKELACPRHIIGSSVGMFVCLLCGNMYDLYWWLLWCVTCLLGLSGSC